MNAVINGPTHTAINGDVIQIPCSGTQTVTWPSTLTTTKNITITALGASPNSSPSTFGAGANCLTIVDNNSSGPVFSLMPTYAATNNVVTLQNINIDPVSGSTALWSPVSVAGTCTSSGCPNVRIDNLEFGKATQWNESGNSSNAATMIRADNVFGVIDHNTLPSASDAVFANISHSAYLGVGAYGDNSWAQPDLLGTANSLFLENNIINFSFVSATDAEFAPVGGGIGGGRQVDRFNQVTSDNGYGVFGLHGLDTDGRPRSGRLLEVYGNSITCTNSSCNIIAGYRGGTGYTFGNSMNETGTGFFDYFAAIAVYRTVYNPTPWGYCGGLNSLDAWDTNDNTVAYSGTMTTSGSGMLVMTDSSKSWATNQLIPSGAPYSVYDTTQNFVSEIASNTGTTITILAPISESSWSGFSNGDSYEIIRSTVCVDQGGRGQGNYISGSTPSPASALSQALDPIYEFNDSESPVRLNYNFDSQVLRTIANRDWYTDNSNGTPKKQTSPTSPFNGTSGVGFGTLANRPTSCTPYVGYFATDQGSWNTSGNSFGQGQFFVCAASNTWTLHYTPYAYPHPLITGSTVATPNPATNLNYTVLPN